MTLTLNTKKNALKDSVSCTGMTESCKCPIAFTLMIYGSIFVEQKMCSRFDEECITSRGDEVRELFSMPYLYLCDSTDNPKPLFLVQLRHHGMLFSTYQDFC